MENMISDGQHTSNMFRQALPPLTSSSINVVRAASINNMALAMQRKDSLRAL